MTLKGRAQGMPKGGMQEVAVLPEPREIAHRTVGCWQWRNLGETATRILSSSYPSLLPSSSILEPLGKRFSCQTCSLEQRNCREWSWEPGDKSTSADTVRCAACSLNTESLCLCVLISLAINHWPSPAGWAYLNNTARLACWQYWFHLCTVTPASCHIKAGVCRGVLIWLVLAKSDPDFIWFCLGPTLGLRGERTEGKSWWSKKNPGDYLLITDNSLRTLSTFSYFVGL